VIGKKEIMDGKEFLENKKERMSTLGFWDEISKPTLIYLIECGYKKEIIKEWYINDIMYDGEKAVINWKKRWRELTDKEVKEKYGFHA
jgi:hypothetical protein